MDTQTQFMELISAELGMGVATALIILIAISLWSLVWKGVALWKAARLHHKGWFVTLLIINTLGILEIIYIFFIAKKEEESSNESI